MREWNFCYAYFYIQVTNCVLEAYYEHMEAEKSCLLVQTMHYSFPIYDLNLFFNISCFQDSCCVPTTVYFAYAVESNATEQSLFCHGLIRSLSLSSVISLVGTAFPVLCATQVLPCSSPHLCLPPQNISLYLKKPTLFQMLVFQLTLLEDTREKSW